MKTPNFDRMTDEQLTVSSAAAAKERGAAVLDSETRRANRMFDRMWAIDKVLRARGRDSRLELLRPIDDKDRFVQYYAALYLLGLVPDRARAVIEWNHKHWFDALAGDAGMLLLAFDRVEYKPD
jgi:hypothetical protein